MVPGGGDAKWVFVAASDRPNVDADYYLAVCAREDETLQRARLAAANIMYELPADRLGERIRAALALQRLLDEKNTTLEQKDAHIRHLEQELGRQGAWAAGLEKQIHELRRTWYVRLFGPLHR